MRPGTSTVGIGVAVVVHALDEGIRAVADADDRDAHLVGLVARCAVGVCGAVAVAVCWGSCACGFPSVNVPGLTPRQVWLVTRSAARMSWRRTWKMRCRTVKLDRAASR